jgi:hypothetical protein
MNGKPTGDVTMPSPLIIVGPSVYFELHPYRSNASV